jgi:hypothetical protein
VPCGSAERKGTPKTAWRGYGKQKCQLPGGYSVLPDSWRRRARLTPWWEIEMPNSVRMRSAIAL